MMSVAAALKTFFGSFDLPAYSTDTIPEDVELPYISYLLTEPEWNQKATMYAQVWARDTSNSFILNKADEIVSTIGTGLRIKLTEGYLVIWPESPQVQVIVDGDIRSAYINLSINAYHTPGV